MENQLEEQIQFAKDCIKEAKDCMNSNRYKDAETLALRVKGIAYDCKNFDMYVEALNILGLVYDALGRFDKSAESLLEGLDIALEHDIFVHAAIICNNLGSHYQNYGAFEQAEKMYASAKEYASKCRLKDSPEFSDTLNMNLGSIRQKRGDIAGAMECVRQLDDRADASGKRNDFEYSKLSFVCLVHWKNGDKEFVYDHIDELVSLAKDCEGIDFYENTHDMVELLRLMGDGDRLKTVLIAASNACKDDNDFFVISLAEMWIDYYKLIGDRDGYLHACERYVNASLRQREAEKQIRAQVIDAMVELREAEREKSQVESLSYVDALTKAGSRNKLLYDSKKIIEDSEMEHTPVGIGLIDIDYFKECNDTYGHITGDKCLKAVADIIIEAVGDTGSVYRFGGDEFLVMVPNAGKEHLEELGEKINKGVHKANIPNLKSPISNYVTVSQGYTRAIAEKGDSIERLIDIGDQVLYQVKRYGRNGYRFLEMSEILKIGD